MLIVNVVSTSVMRTHSSAHWAEKAAGLTLLVVEGYDSYLIKRVSIIHVVSMRLYFA